MTGISGDVAEGLGSGLQSRVPRFKSGRRLGFLTICSASSAAQKRRVLRGVAFFKSKARIGNGLSIFCGYDNQNICTQKILLTLTVHHKLRRGLEIFLKKYLQFNFYSFIISIR